MELEELINDLKKSIEHFTVLMEDPNEIEKYKDTNRYAVIMLGYLEELKHLRVVNKNISRELITRTDKLTNKKDAQIIEKQKNMIQKVNLEAQKYFDLLMEDERVINEMAEHIDTHTYKDSKEDYGCDFEMQTNCICNNKDCHKCIINYFRGEV